MQCFVQTRRIHFWHRSVTQCLKVSCPIDSTIRSATTIDFAITLLFDLRLRSSQFSFSSFLKPLRAVQVYPPDNHCIKLTRETKTKATISLEKLVKIATKRVLLARWTFLITTHYSRSISPPPRCNFLQRNCSVNCFLLPGRQFYSHTWKKRKSPRCIRRRFVMPAFSLFFSLSLDHRFHGSRSTGMQHLFVFVTQNIERRVVSYQNVCFLINS